MGGSGLKQAERIVLNALYFGFLIFLIADIFFQRSGLDPLQRTSFIVAMLILPSAQVLKFLGMEFQRRTEETLVDIQEAFPKLEQRVVKLEQQGQAPQKTTKTHQISSAVQIAAADSKDIIRRMLEDKAFSMRSKEALLKATGLNEEILQAEVKEIGGINTYLSSDGTVYYGLRSRNRSRRRAD